MAELVADSIRRRIMSGEFETGLPKEEELREQYGVAKNSMREALLILKTEGLITVRRGNKGGSSVHLPTADTASYSLGLVLAATRATLSDLAGTLRIVEPLCALSCAQREDRAESLVPRLEALNSSYLETIEDGVSAIRTSRDFHETVIAGCANPALSLVTTSLARLWSAHEASWATEAALEGRFPSLEERHHSLDWHRQIAGAISEGDPSVEDMVRAHLVEAQALTLESHSGKADRRSAASNRVARVAPVARRRAEGVGCREGSG